MITKKDYVSLLIALLGSWLIGGVLYTTGASFIEYVIALAGLSLIVIGSYEMGSNDELEETHQKP